MTPAEWREGLAQTPVRQRELLSEGGGALLLFRGQHAGQAGNAGSPDGGYLTVGEQEGGRK